MTTLLERVAQFGATMLLLGGDSVEGTHWDDWRGWGQELEPDDNSDLWECNRQWDFPTMTVELHREEGGHYIKVERFSRGVYVDTANIPGELSFDRAQRHIVKLLEKADEQR